ncbi:choice-of-anchor tandem repeat GloVer-containing protein [Nostoc sp. C117]|uniref:choice-of-anchor tandem repeat GloVer-containing protein n=1 Tax=Nostoc sp. C117 TaxID=3349875 RepID=UPI00370D7B3E
MNKMNLCKQRQTKKRALILTSLTVLALPLVLPLQKAAAFSFSPVINFNGTNGAEPKAGVLKGSDNNLYGTTSQGGSSSNNGTAFKLSGPTLTTLTTLINFNGTASPNKGTNPVARLFQAADGTLYGVTATGGTSNLGTLFKLASPSFTTLTTLVDFSGILGTKVGGNPAGRLISGSDGNFWGTTSTGGVNNLGTIFKISPSGTLTTVAIFNGTNGAIPLARLQQATDGKYYGTASEGGATDRGVVFEYDSATATLTVSSFNGANGEAPQSGLIESGGFLYGTTKRGGGSSNKGVIFKIPLGFTSSTAPTLVVSFNGTNGAKPTAALTPGASGIFYGTTSAGGVNGTGVIYKLTTTGTPTITTLYSFNALGTGGTNVGGARPESTLIPVGTDYYGTASGGGTSGRGTVFKFTP